MNKQQLASRIWESANKMRSKIEANEYKDYILGFIFYKFLSDQELAKLRKEGFGDDDLPSLTEENQEIVKHVQNTVGYFIGYEHLFSTWLEKKSEFNVGDVRDALSAFNRLISPDYKKVFTKVFDTLETGLSKLGDTSKSQTKAVSDLLYLIKDIPMDGKQDYDVLGFIYEYLISNFAANAGKKAGEFYTPHEVSVLMSEIVAEHLKDRKEIKIYDPTSGSGSLLINIGKAAARHIGEENKVKYYAQELKENTYNLTRMNLIMRGILPSNIEARNGDTLEQDWPWFDEADPLNTYAPLYVDAVVSNPPYSQQWTPPINVDPRFKDYGLAPKSKADYAFLLHDLSHLKPEGIMTIVLPHGVLFRGAEEGVIRSRLIENNNIDAVIGLPPNIFFGTGIPTIIMVLRQNRERSDVLIVDASKGFEKVGKNNRLRASDIRRIADVVAARRDVPGFSRVVSKEEIRENDYNLNIPRYVDSSEKPESQDVYALMFGGVPNREIDELAKFWDAFPGLKESLFRAKNAEYSTLAPSDVKRTVQSAPAVAAFRGRYASAFDGFEGWLRRELTETPEKVDLAREESRISDEIFKRLSGVPLVDPYEAYQILDDAWAKIAVDLEIIQTEGFDATRKVDPNMVIKKKNGVDAEVQEGWLGHVVPFELAQESYFAAELTKLKEDEARLAETVASYDEYLDELPEEEKEKPFVNDDGSAFVWAEVKKAIKSGGLEPDVLTTLKKAQAANEAEKKLKKQVKTAGDALHLATKERIEKLSDEEVAKMLVRKWIAPLVENLARIPDEILDGFVARLEKLAAKYDSTLSELEDEIQQTERELAEMLDQLTGNEFDMAGLAELRKSLGGL